MNSFLAYMGGKSLLTQRIIPRIPAHQCYVEVFAGAAWLRYFKWILVARDEFERFKKEEPDTLTDIQRAARFYYLMKLGYGARIKSPSFSVAGADKKKQVTELLISNFKNA